MGKFQKGEKRPANAGRKPGSINKTTSIVRATAFLAAQQTGDPKKRGRGGLLGYMRFIARDYPPVFFSMLVRGQPLQVRVDAQTEIIYRSIAEIESEMASRGFPIDEIGPLLTQSRPTNEEERDAGGSKQDEEDNDA
jgi:hypothetical protein